MTQKTKIGIIGLDTSHVIAFAKILQDPANEYHIPGFELTAAFPGGSPDMEASRSRVQGYTDELRNEYGVVMKDTIAEVAGAVDAILLESVDGRVHKDQFAELAPFGKPVFIDKPLATSVADALAIAQLARQHSVPVMTSSALRYSEPFQAALQAEGEPFGIDCSGPMAIQPPQPGVFWYGVHTTEMLFTALGPDCLQVQAQTNDDHDVLVGTWRDGRLGTLRGNRVGSNQFSALLHFTDGIRFVDVASSAKPFYASLLEQITQFFLSGQSPIPLWDSLQIVNFMESANESRITGRPVPLQDLSAHMD